MVADERDADVQAVVDFLDVWRYSSSPSRQCLEDAANQLLDTLSLKARVEAAEQRVRELEKERVPQVGDGEEAAKPYELRAARYEIRRATEELDKLGVEKYDNREPSSDSTDESMGCGAEWSIQHRIPLAVKSAEAKLATAVEALRQALSEIEGD